MFFYIGGPILALTLLYQFAIADKIDELSILKQRVPAQQADLNEARRIRNVIARRQANEDALQQKIQKRGAGFDAFVFLKNIADRVNLKDRHTITLQNPRGSKESRFALKGWKVVLKGVSQVEVGEFMRQVYEADQLLHISEFSLTPEKNANGLHAEISIVTLFNK